VKITPNGARSYAQVTMPTGLEISGGHLYASAWGVAIFLGQEGRGEVGRSRAVPQSSRRDTADSRESPAMAASQADQPGRPRMDSRALRAASRSPRPTRRRRRRGPGPPPGRTARASRSRARRTRVAGSAASAAAPRGRRSRRRAGPSGRRRPPRRLGRRRPPAARRTAAPAVAAGVLACGQGGEQPVGECALCRTERLGHRRQYVGGGQHVALDAPAVADEVPAGREGPLTRCRRPPAPAHRGRRSAGRRPPRRAPPDGRGPRGAAPSARPAISRLPRPRRLRACTATTPTPGRALGTARPTARMQDDTAMPRSPVAGSRARTEKVMRGPAPGGPRSAVRRWR
jgi:hypothetical protein